jgi:carbamoyl-phosphate synthase small subunit
MIGRNFDVEKLVAATRGFAGLEGVDLAKSDLKSYRWDDDECGGACEPASHARLTQGRHKVVCIDYGAKRNILRCLASAGSRRLFCRDGGCRAAHNG